MPNCIIVDDYPEAIEVIEEHLKKIPQLVLVKTFENSIEALTFLEKNNIDIVFLDIQMPHLSGIELIESLKNRNKDNLPSFILTTGYSQYAESAFEQRASDYLIKPIGFKKLKMSIERIIEDRTSNPNKDYFFVEFEGARVKINYKDIAYVESDGNYITIAESKIKKRLIYNKTLKYIEEILCRQGFLRVHKSFIISKSHVVTVKFPEIILKAEGVEIEIPIGRKYKNIVFSTFPSI
jgi:DNA-binding LytR/AlgR family response regulator